MTITEWIEWSMEQGKYYNCKACAQESSQIRKSPGSLPEASQKPSGTLPEPSRIPPGIHQGISGNYSWNSPEILLEFRFEFFNNSPVTFLESSWIFSCSSHEILLEYAQEFPLKFSRNSHPIPF